MKITIITKECKTKDKDAPAKANLCFRLRDKDVDLKVRSDIDVMLDYWDNDTLSYRRTKKLPSDEQKKVKVLVQTITTALSEQYNSATADVAWMKNVIDEMIDQSNFKVNRDIDYSCFENGTIHCGTSHESEISTRL